VVSHGALLGIMVLALVVLLITAATEPSRDDTAG
jgi:hypothetical protein